MSNWVFSKKEEMDIAMGLLRSIGIMSKDAAKEFCKAIKYYDKIEFVDGCKYVIEHLGKTDIAKYMNYDSFEEAIAASLEYRDKLAKKGGAICIGIHNPNFEFFSADVYRGRDIFELKKACTKYVPIREIYVSPEYDRIYMECLVVYKTEESFVNLSYDYELMFGNRPELKLDTPYVSSFNDFIKHCSCVTGYCKKYHYYSVGKKQTKIRTPFMITEQELSNTKNTLYNGDDLYYGILGYYQRSTRKGVIIDRKAEAFRKILPIASISEYAVKRPVIHGICRYKVHLTLPSCYSEEKKDFITYVDCAVGDVGSVKKKAIDNCLERNVEVDYVEIVPEGEWAI